MISDRTIDEKTAKYWCAFADNNFKKALDEVLKTISDEKSQEIAQNAIQTQLNEGFIDKLSKFQPADPTGGSVGIVVDLAGKTPEQIKANTIALGTAAAAAAAVTPIGRKIVTAVGKTALKNPGTTLLGIGATKLAADAVSEKDDSWWEKLEKLVNKIWDIGQFTAKHGKAIALAGTVVYSLFKTAGLWMPMLGSFVKSILRGNSLATVDFDSNGRIYRMRYDVKHRRWELIYKGFSMGATPPPEETEQLMDTRFFKRFFEQCKRYIEPIVVDERRNAVVEAISKLSNKDTKDVLDRVFKDPETLDNMLALKFKY